MPRFPRKHDFSYKSSRSTFVTLLPNGELVNRGAVTTTTPDLSSVIGASNVELSSNFIARAFCSDPESSVSSDSLMADEDGIIHYSDSEESEHFIQMLVQGIQRHNRFFIRCQNFLKLAEMCQSLDVVKKMRENNALEKMLGQMKYSSNENRMVVFCEALFLRVLTKHKLDGQEIKIVDKLLRQYIKASCCSSPPNQTENRNTELSMLTSHLQESALKCVQAFPHREIISTSEVNVLFLSCASLHDICVQAGSLDSESSFSTIYALVDRFCDLTSSAEFRSIKPLTGYMNESDAFRVVTIQQCLQVFEQVLHENSAHQELFLQYKNCALLKCFDKLLSVSMKHLFTKSDRIGSSIEELNFENVPSVATKATYLHQLCLVSILKVLLKISPNQAISSLSEVSCTLMQKLMICFFETNLSNIDNKFELCLMTLELMINFREFKLIDNVQFTKLCLKKFHIEKFYAAVDILIKVLECSLIQVLTLWEQNKQQMENAQRQSNNQNPSVSNMVFHIAEEHMEKSFISSYISVLLSQFCCREKFYKYVAERVQKKYAKAAVIAMENFKEFIPIMGSQNARAYILLDNALKVFTDIYNEKQA